ncbi:MAG: ABC transporter permease, partial [Anaerolineales bacterium]|nr:ABC transporter permease [Anaerolineales bacterium]
MTQYFVRRLLESIPVLVGVSMLVFLLLHLIPGDPAVALLGERATPERIDEVRDQLGLNRPLYEQYFIWVGKVIQGDLGETINGRIPVSKELRNRFPATIELAIAALVFAVILGVPIGIISAIRRNSLIDTMSMFGALFGVSIPIFVLGLLLIFFVGVKLRLLPFIGRLDPDIELEKITGMYVVDSILTGNMKALKNSLEHLV